MTKKIKKNNILAPFKIGEIAEGKVISRGKSAIFLDLGAKGTGIIFGREFYNAKEQLKNVETGDSLSAKVIEVDNEDGYVELSLSQAEKELVWQDLQEKKEKAETVKITVLGANKGGLLARVSGLAAFLPVSQLSAEHYPKVEGGDRMKILRALQEFVGQELEVRIFDLSPKQEKLILSEKIIEPQKELVKEDAQEDLTIK